MAVNAIVQLSLYSRVIQTHWLLCLVKVLDASLSVLLVLDFQLLGKLLVDFDHFFLVNGLFFDVQVVHDKEVLCT